MENILKNLVAIPSPSGFEHRVIRYLYDYLKDKVDEMHVDGLGNLIVKKCGVEDGPVLMLSAHTDEVGFIVKKIEENGLIRFEKVGGNDDRNLPTERVLICTEKGDLPGVTGTISAHMRKFDNADLIRPYNMSYIDIGAESKEEAIAMGVQVGDAIGWGTSYQKLGKNRVITHGLDDKAGCAILASMFAELDFSKVKGTVYGIFSVQEEVGLRGAHTAAQTLRADVALALDTTAASDTMEPMMDQTVCLGKGVGIKAMDASLVASPIVVRKLRKVAVANEIPYQVEIFTGIGTDAGQLHLSHEGVPTSALSIPSRYAHSPNEEMDLRDFAATRRLLDAFILSLGDKEEFRFI